MESNPDCNIYQYKKAECELCKTKFPDFIKHKGTIYEILDFFDDFNHIFLRNIFFV